MPAYIFSHYGLVKLRIVAGSSNLTFRGVPFLFTQTRHAPPLLAVLSHLPPRFSYTLGHCGHAPGQGDRQPATAKRPVFFSRVYHMPDKSLAFNNNYSGNISYTLMIFRELEFTFEGHLLYYTIHFTNSYYSNSYYGNSYDGNSYLYYSIPYFKTLVLHFDTRGTRYAHCELCKT